MRVITLITGSHHAALCAYVVPPHTVSLAWLCLWLNAFLCVGKRRGEKQHPTVRGLRYLHDQIRPLFVVCSTASMLLNKQIHQARSVCLVRLVQRLKQRRTVRNHLKTVPCCVSKVA